MAYALRYYKEIAQADGGVVRLEIHKKDSTTAAVEIGAVVQGLSLEIQGQQDDIDSPIQKTSLHMTFVDASDIENGQKNGFWQEFYTPDALMWKVILKAKDATETSFRTVWGGYVTPDSFSEDLVYRGSVSITARDNIGHMQDFPFDAEGDADGMISLYNLVESGWEKIQSPMMLEWRGAADSTMWLMCDGVSAMFTLMNVSMFEGMDWYKAIETALASYGVVMRYVGNNIVKMSSLRSMPYQGEEFIEDLIHIEPTFVSGATRELIPAVKRIEERVEYDVTDSVTAPQLKSDDFTGESSSVVLSTSTGSQFILEGWSIKNTERGEGWMNNVGNPYFFPDAYDLSLLVDADSRDDEFMWFSFSQYATGDNRYAVYSRRIMPCAITMRLAFGSPYRLVNRVLTPVGNARADYAMIAIEVVADGVSYFLQKNGGWGNNLDLLTYNNEQVSNGELVIDIPTDGFDQSIILNVRIYEAGYYSWAQDTYIPLYSLDFSANNVVMERNIVNTNYNAENNVILSRDPEIGPAYDKVAFPVFIKNGIFYRNGNAILPAKKWSWGSGSEQQMAVWNHLQLLSYYAKPNNLISGTIVNADITRAQAIYIWHGAEHILVSGTYNFLNGHIEGAVLREFARYEDMWNEVAGADLPDTEQESRSNVEGGSASGGSSSTYTNTTTVNIGSGGGGTGASYLNDLLDVNTDSVTAQSVLYYNGTEWVGRSLSAILNGYAKSADLLTLSNLLASMWSIDADGNLVTDKQVIIKNNLIVEGDTASGGEGGGSSSVGITGIVVNGVTYMDTDGDGLIDLGTIGGGTLTEITYEMIVEALGYTPLSTSGGTISVISDEGISINRTNGTRAVLSFKVDGGYKGGLGIDTDGVPFYRTYVGGIHTLIHSGNYSDYALPLTGTTNTLSYTNNTILVFNNNGTGSGSGIRYDVGGSAKAWIGYDGSSYGASLLSYASGKHLGIKDDGTPYYDGNTLIHSGNIGDYTIRYYSNKGDIDFNNELNNGLQYVSGLSSNGGKAYDIMLSTCISDSAWQLVGGRSGELRYRGGIGTASGWGSWKTIAFTDSNVASAYKLITSAGADAVVPNANGYTYVYGDLRVWAQDASDRVVRLRNAPSDLYTRLKADGSGEIFVSGNYALKFGTANTARMVINSSGNVTIGNQDLAGADVKMAVYGTTRIHRSGSSREYLEIDLTDASVYYNAYDSDGWCSHFFQSNGTTIMTLLGTNGNVGIGTTDPALKLDVNGGIRAYSEIAFARKGASYIWGEEGAVLHIGVKDVGGTSPAYASLSIGANTIRSGSRNNAVSLGDSGIRWSNVYSVDGNFSGAVTISSTLSVGSDTTISGNLVVTGDISA